MNPHQSIQSILEKLTPDHLRLLEVCVSYPKGESGSFCGEWIMHACEKQAIRFHQAWLTKLANVGLLVKEDASRRGHRRYYRIEHPEFVQAALSQARITAASPSIGSEISS